MLALYRLYLKFQRLRRYIRTPVTQGSRVLAVRGGQVLLVRLTYARGWYLPGGGVDRGESFKDSARRELREECGLEVLDLKLFGLYLNRLDGRLDHVAVYLTTDLTGQPTIGDPREIAAAQFFPVHQLPADLWPGHRRRIEEYMGWIPVDDRW